MVSLSRYACGTIRVMVCYITGRSITRIYSSEHGGKMPLP